MEWCGGVSIPYRYVVNNLGRGRETAWAGVSIPYRYVVNPFYPHSHQLFKLRSIIRFPMVFHRCSPKLLIDQHKLSYNKCRRSPRIFALLGIDDILGWMIPLDFTISGLDHKVDQRQTRLISHRYVINHAVLHPSSPHQLFQFLIGKLYTPF